MTVGKRATRKDKKRQVRPTVPIILCDKVRRLAFVTRSPIKSVCEECVTFSLNSAEIIASLAPYIRRDITLDQTFLHGGDRLNKLRLNEDGGETERLSMKLTQEIYGTLSVLAYGLDKTISFTAGLVLNEGMQSSEFVEGYVRAHLLNSIDDYHMKEVEKVLRSVKKDKSLAGIISAIIEEVQRPSFNVKQIAGELLINDWRRNG